MYYYYVSLARLQAQRIVRHSIGKTVARLLTIFGAVDIQKAAKAYALTIRQM